jgi:transposase InsO family protein
MASNASRSTSPAAKGWQAAFIHEMLHILFSMSRKGNPYDNAFAESSIETQNIEEVSQ